MSAKSNQKVQHALKHRQKRISTPKPTPGKPVQGKNKTLTSSPPKSSSPSVSNQSPLAQGTIISSGGNYNDLIMEYHLFADSNGSPTHLIIYFRMVNFDSDYMIGLDLDPQPKSISQLIYHPNLDHAANNSTIINY